MKENGLQDVQAKSVIKKMKDKAFAKNVSRDDIRKGSEEIGLSLEEHITNIINAMKSNSQQI